MIFRKVFYSVLVALSILLVSCEKLDDYDIVNLNGNQVGIVGHGGAGFVNGSNLIPDNSVRAVRRAINGFGIEGVEVDVQMSYDGELFLYHDLQLQSRTDCQGTIGEQTSSVLMDCSYRSNFAARFIDDLFLPRLEDVILEFKDYTKKPLFYLDMRTVFRNNSVYTDSLNNELARKVADLVDKYNGYDWIFVESGNFEFLKLVRAYNPKVLVLYDGDITQENVEKIVELGVKGIVSNFSTISKDKVSYAHDNGLQVSVFDLKSRGSHLKAINNNVDFIQSDNVELLMDILNGR